MSLSDMIRNVQIEYPEAFEAIFRDGMIAEQRYQASVRVQEKSIARSGKITVRPKNYVPFP
jgi:hypothetical protein